MSDVLAILVSDIHLSHRPPAARAVEPDWYEAMARPLKEISKLAEKYDVSVICGGDVFDRWNSPPELINFALDTLPFMFAIPGQHDLPNHSHDEMHRSAFRTLVSAGKIQELYYNDPINVGFKLVLHPFPWGCKIGPLEVKTKYMNLAVIHSYCWISGTEYYGAPVQNKLGMYKSQLKGYNVALFGDNHIGFGAVTGECQVFNAGAMMRRSRDQVNYAPRIGLLYSNGVVATHLLATSKDVFDVVEVVGDQILDADSQKFIDELEKLGTDALDFHHAIDVFLQTHGTDPEVRRTVERFVGRER